MSSTTMSGGRPAPRPAPSSPRPRAGPRNPRRGSCRRVRARGRARPPPAGRLARRHFDSGAAAAGGGQHEREARAAPRRRDQIDPAPWRRHFLAGEPEPRPGRRRSSRARSDRRFGGSSLRPVPGPSSVTLRLTSRSLATSDAVTLPASRPWVTALSSRFRSARRTASPSQRQLGRLVQVRHSRARGPPLRARAGRGPTAERSSSAGSRQCVGSAGPARRASGSSTRSTSADPAVRSPARRACRTRAARPGPPPASPPSTRIVVERRAQLVRDAGQEGALARDRLRLRASARRRLRRGPPRRRRADSPQHRSQGRSGAACRAFEG